ncbi:hypothetical protein EVAR_16789_1 [Eumeta japonica]|uniref:Uncharacterized protein n=1 Tax=Eumeta variegata TaxID=151549 RepID=A0A4C1UKY5_EUMVA|nr:hypothetical protein EVAR_16789_1 [Eumeta japonica]
MERSMVWCKWQDRVRNYDLTKKTKLLDILSQIDRQKWRCTSHMMRDTRGKWSKAVTEWYPRDENTALPFYYQQSPLNTRLTKKRHVSREPIRSHPPYAHAARTTTKLANKAVVHPLKTTNYPPRR